MEEDTNTPYYSIISIHIYLYLYNFQEPIALLMIEIGIKK